jgi:hypothetical protein
MTAIPASNANCVAGVQENGIVSGMSGVNGQVWCLMATDTWPGRWEKARHERVVLLFDTHEAFFGEAIADPQALLHAHLVRPACPRGSSVRAQDRRSAQDGRVSRLP